MTNIERHVVLHSVLQACSTWHSIMPRCNVTLLYQISLAVCLYVMTYCIIDCRISLYGIRTSILLCAMYDYLILSIILYCISLYIIQYDVI